jgi:hypothetical protein
MMVVSGEAWARGVYTRGTDDRAEVQRIATSLFGEIRGMVSAINLTPVGGGAQKK